MPRACTIFQTWSLLVSPLMSLEWNMSYSRFRQIQKSSQELYGLIHARFIEMAAGIDSMFKKFQAGDFGLCPRELCRRPHINQKKNSPFKGSNWPLLPVGLHSSLGRSTLKLYCPVCRDLYEPENQAHQNIDGAYFGPNSAHILLRHLKPLWIYFNRYEPRIYGFKIYKKEAKMDELKTVRKDTQKKRASRELVKDRSIRLISSARVSTTISLLEQH